ncbi:hypothetical protein ACM0P6_14860 (plasmid) [Komagataeibacter sucrofermentans]|uniref:Uncharacterized protein n=1 Tax=Komagataeibacter sucrofermentans TaxID=1053551 RepID=A0A318QQA0_9PROT|nr:hypothetical protein [Komagataeibacter sucrofermentans]PYD77409.1 hypothetical protein CFR77_15460 [Komagataeibacter sucrofermentans]GBQ50773.1 hypothetical protein AA15973_2208 [Komagataeibacter sucrofermentans DSM 15973]
MKEGKARVELGDGLVQYMMVADETMRALWVADNPLVKALLQYDAYFRHDLWEHVSPKPTRAFILFLNAYQMFLGAARMALSGHPAAVFPLVRTALESASYGYLMEQQPALAEVWGNRHRSETDKRACRNAFTFDKAIKGLVYTGPDIYRLAKEAYESTIDYGAHPNLKGVFGHVSINEDRPDGMVAVIHTSLYGSGHHETIRGICACLDFSFVIIGIITLSGETVTTKLQDELHALNNIKEAAIAAYQSAR